MKGRIQNNDYLMVDKMNMAASNKLLKLLEEPPEKTIFILSLRK
jgi:DNA polymerase III gamma/tau subunit